jgi:hypothetical protein
MSALSGKTHCTSITTLQGYSVCEVAFAAKPVKHLYRYFIVLSTAGLVANQDPGYSIVTSI